MPDDPLPHRQQIDDYAVRINGQRYGFIQFSTTDENPETTFTRLDMGPWGRMRVPVDASTATISVLTTAVLSLVLVLLAIRKWWMVGRRE
jgi:hypothetical protein